MQDLYTWGANLAKILLISFYSDRKEEVEQINAPPPLGIYDERCNLLPWQTPDLKALVRFKILSRDLFDYWFFMLWAVAKNSHVHSTLAWILHIKKLIQVCLTSYLKMRKNTRFWTVWTWMIILFLDAFETWCCNECRPEHFYSLVLTFSSGSFI